MENDYSIAMTCLQVNEEKHPIRGNVTNLMTLGVSLPFIIGTGVHNGIKKERVVIANPL